MFKWIFSLSLTLVFSSLLYAGDITLSWDPSPTPDVVGYKIYYKLGDTQLPLDGTGAVEGASPVDAGNQLTATLTGLSDTSTYYFAVTAYDAAGYESSFSNFVSNQLMIPLIRPGNGVTGEPSTVTFQWDNSGDLANYTFTLFYGADQGLVTDASIFPINSPQHPLPWPAILLFLIAVVLAYSQNHQHDGRRVPTRALPAILFALSISLAACGGGGGTTSSGGGTTLPPDPPPVVPDTPVALASIPNLTNTDYYQEFDLVAGSTYYWKVVGVDQTNPTKTVTSEIYSFTTAP